MSSASAPPPAPENGAGPGDAEHATMALAVAAAAAASADADHDQTEDGDFDEVPSVDDKRAKRGFSKRVTLRDLERYFEYPIEEVSKMMGVSTTIIKRLCRKYGIKRWPYRQVRERTWFVQDVVACPPFQKKHHGTITLLLFSLRILARYGSGSGLLP